MYVYVQKQVLKIIWGTRTFGKLSRKLPSIHDVKNFDYMSVKRYYVENVSIEKVNVRNRI